MFDGVDFSGGLWDAFANTTLGGPVNGALQFMQASVVFNETGQTVRPDGVIARLSISTAGITSGSYALRLAETQIDENTDFIRVGGSPLVPLVTNGTLRIIPEPSTAILAVLGCLGACISQRARRGRMIPSTEYSVLSTESWIPTSCCHLPPTRGAERLVYWATRQAMPAVRGEIRRGTA